MGQAISGDRVDGTLSDITERKRLEEERERIELELRVAQKLEAVGQLAAGIAHEINTPIRFVGDSVGFLRESFADLQGLVADYEALCRRAANGRADADAILAELAEAEERADLDYLEQRVPAAFERTVDGIGRVATIVGAMRDFGRPSQVSQAPADLNHALSSTLIVASHAYKHVAEIEMEFGELPPVVCNVSDLNQVFLNLIVNAAHAIEDASGAGTIRVRTGLDEDAAVITIADTGTGIPQDVRARIFDPFFTTKKLGRGTGQGLAIARSIVVEKHGGTLTLESEPGRGSEFAIRLPVAGLA